MSINGDNYPVRSDDGGIKLKPEKMEIEKLYHCIHDNKVFLFYKDSDELLHCYEINEPDVVKEIELNPNDVEKILQRHNEN